MHLQWEEGRFYFTVTDLGKGLFKKVPISEQDLRALILVRSNNNKPVYAILNLTYTCLKYNVSAAGVIIYCIVKDYWQTGKTLIYYLLVSHSHEKKDEN